MIARNPPNQLPAAAIHQSSHYPRQLVNPAHKHNKASMWPHNPTKWCQLMATILYFVKVSFTMIQTFLLMILNESQNRVVFKPLEYIGC